MSGDCQNEGQVIGFFFNGAYALLGDVDSADAAATIFELKRRPTSQTLSLVTDPRHWAEFVDLDSPALHRFPLPVAAGLHERLHALGVVYPADPAGAPGALVQDGTILNVWTRYAPLIELQQQCRARGSRALLGASANLSGEPTYVSVRQMSVFDGRLGAVFEPDDRVPAARQNSVSLVDLSGDAATLLREGNTTEAEVRAALHDAGLGPMEVSPEIRRL